LAYADFLAGHGQPERAEFVRLHLELPQVLPEDPPWITLPERQGWSRGLDHHEHEDRYAIKGRDWEWHDLTHVRRYTAHRTVELPDSPNPLRDLLLRLEEILAEHAESWIAGTLTDAPAPAGCRRCPSPAGPRW